MTTILVKDEYLKKYVVWEVHRNYQIEKFRGFKYQCEEWLNEKKK